MPFEFQNALDSDPTTPKDDDILHFVENALRVADRQTILTLGKVSNAQLILEKTGLNVTGFTRVLDNYGVRHTLKQHGNSVKEDRRGQIAVTAEDFAKISSITSAPDNIFADGKNKIGRDVIVFVKLIDGVGYRHVEELRGKHKLVATDSVRKKKGAWSARKMHRLFAKRHPRRVHAGFRLLLSTSETTSRVSLHFSS